MTIRDVLQGHAARIPDRTAVIYLHHQGAAEMVERRTYAALDRRARAIAAHLQARLRPGDRAVLLHRPGLAAIEAVLACLYAGVVAIVLAPSRSERSLQRVAVVLRDAGARLLLWTGEQQAIGPGALERTGAPDTFATDGVPDGDADNYRAATLPAGSLAYLQYTSGSSGTPKGVMVPHEALLSNLSEIREAFRHDDSSVGVNWLPLHHDMGLVGTLLQPLHVGFPAVLMSPMAFAQRPERWLRAIARYGGTSCGGPNFAYQLCVDRVSDDVRRTLDLRTWRIAFCGAEPIHPATVRRFSDLYASCGFRAASFFPCYGLAEATLLVTSARVDTPPVIRSFDAAALERACVKPASGPAGGAVREIVGCGASRTATDVAIADTRGRPLPSDRIGEICVSGPGVASGYWERPDLSRQTFGVLLDGTSGRPWLRTGDTGFVHHGQLFVTGRLKDLVIVDGRNIACHDLEWTAEASDGRVRAAAVFAVEAHGSERPVLLIGVGEAFDASILREIGDNVRRAIGCEHDVALDAVALVWTSALARTTSGKLSRADCRRAYLEGGPDLLARWRADGGWDAGPAAASTSVPSPRLRRRPRA